MKNLKILFFFSIAFLIFSCTKDNDSIVSNNDELEILKRQRSWINKFTPITPCEASTLTFTILGNCGGTPYPIQILNAIQAYNDSPTSIFFTQIGNPLVADLVFNCVDGDNCGEANASLPFNHPYGPNVQTTFPSGGTIGGQIDLEINWENCLCTDPDEEGCNFTNNEPACMFLRTVMHEIGHVLGIAHNDDCTGTHIQRTPDEDDDPNSIFNSGPVTDNNCDWCDAPCEFNVHDIIALQSIYPEVMLECVCPGLFSPCACEENISITFPSILEDEECIQADDFFTVCAFDWAGDPAPGASFQWSSTGSIVIDSEDTDTRCVEISVGTTGGTISITVTNDACGTNSTFRTIEICEEEDPDPDPNPNPGPGPSKVRPKAIE